jgi:hypothetical protein
MNPGAMPLIDEVARRFRACLKTRRLGDDRPH